MKKVKLFATIASLCLAVGVFCFGVFSAQNITYTIGGSISYEVSDVFANVTTRVYTSAFNDSATLQTEAEKYANGTGTGTLTDYKYDFSTTGKDSESYSNKTEMEGNTTGGINIEYDTKDKRTYIVVVSVTNKGSNIINVTATTPSLDASANTVIVKVDKVAKIEKDGTGKIVFAFMLNDTKTGIGGVDFNYIVTIANGEYVEPAYLYNDIGDDDNNLASYLAGQLNAYQEDINSISFTNVKPTGTAMQEVNVGQDSSGSVDNSVIAYCTQNSDSKYDIVIYSKDKIVFPEESGRMFMYCTGLTSLDLSNIDTSSVTNMCGMFFYCNSLTNLNLGAFDTSNVTDMSFMFNGCTRLTSLDITKFDTSNVTKMSYMFSGCIGLTSLDVSNFDTSNVTDMWFMFQGCRGLTSLDITKFDTSNVTDMSYMFNDCSVLTSLDITKFVTSKVTNISHMFGNCTRLTSLDVSNFDTSNVTDMSYMFSSCGSLTTLDLSNFDISKVTNYRDFISNCTALITIKTPYQNSISDIQLPSGTWTNSAEGNYMPTTNGTSITLTKAS